MLVQLSTGLRLRFGNKPKNNAEKSEQIRSQEERHPKFMRSARRKGRNLTGNLYAHQGKHACGVRACS